VNERGQVGNDIEGMVLDGSYRIERLLGEGGMSAVYHATHLRLDKPVAIKVMARELASNQEALERFRREARVTSGLGHPHIIQVFDFGNTSTGEPYLVMELLEGEDLDHRLRRVGRLPPAQVASIVKQVASALSSTHAKGVVHRDLKPGNIFLVQVAGEEDFVRVLDFGISKMRSAATKLTRTSSIMGTPNYMSPEQAKGKTDDIDERTDQWALACIAWECLSGVGPFLGENVPSVLFQIVHEPPPSLLPKVAGLPPQVEDVLVRALAKDKADRFPSMTEFSIALTTALSGTSCMHSPTAAVALPTMRFAEGEDWASQPLKATTLTRSAGELDPIRDEPPRDERFRDKREASPNWGLRVVAAGAMVAAASAFVLLRPHSVPKATVVPAAEAPSPLPPAPTVLAPKVEGSLAPAADETVRPSQPVVIPAAAIVELAEERKLSVGKHLGKQKVEARRFTPPSVPSRKEIQSGDRDTPSPKPISPRNKEDRWRVD
jgi:eukaryotic-like serine/threonine-protein kinase